MDLSRVSPSDLQSQTFWGLVFPTQGAWAYFPAPCKGSLSLPLVFHLWVSHLYCRRRRWHPTPGLSPGGSMDRGAWWAAVHGVLRVRHDWATSLSLSCTGKGNGNPLQCSCLENPRDRGSLAGCRLWGRTESDMTEVTQQQQHLYFDFSPPAHLTVVPPLYLLL